MIDIIGFMVCAGIIFFAGKKLSWYGDKIAEKTGWGKAWVGLILLATVTSLPELLVGVSSSAIVQSADLAVGDILGSCTFNLAILAVLDIFVPRRQHLFYLASTRHVLTASLGLILIALIGVSLYLPQKFVLIPGIGVMSVVFFVLYLLSIRLIYHFQRLTIQSDPGEQVKTEESMSLRKLVMNYILFALLIVGAALFVPQFASNIAAQTGLSDSFMGTLFVAASTSLPEIAVSIAAVRLGSIDLAVGNLLGSNIFNVFILSIDDAFYTKGILLKDASEINIISVFSAIIMTAIAIAGFTYRAPEKKFLMAIDSILILLVYLSNLVLMYYLS